MNFYTLNIIISLFSIWIYISFRIGVHSYLRANKNSKSFIKKSTKSFPNYWLYKNLKQELGRIYYLNFILLFGTAVYTLTALSLAPIDILRLPIAILYALLCAVQCFAEIFSSIYCNIEEYGTPFIIWCKSRSGHGRSSVLDVAVVIGLIAFAVYNICLAVN